MSLELADFEDSTDHLYDVLAADEDIDTEAIDEALEAIVAHQVNLFFNRKDEVAESEQFAADTADE